MSGHVWVCLGMFGHVWACFACSGLHSSTLHVIAPFVQMFFDITKAELAFVFWSNLCNPFARRAGIFICIFRVTQFRCSEFLGFGNPASCGLEKNARSKVGVHDFAYLGRPKHAKTAHI